MIRLIGTGPGDGRYALSQALEAIKASRYLAGYPSHVGRFIRPEQELIDLSSSGLGLSAGFERIDQLLERTEGGISIVVSGDPGFHSLLGRVKRGRPGWDLELIPGISAFQVACCRIGIPWQSMKLISFHAPASDALDRFAAAPLPMDGAVLLLGGEVGPFRAAEALLRQVPRGGKSLVWLCSDIGEEQEEIVQLELGEVDESSGGRLCMMILPPQPQPQPQP